MLVLAMYAPQELRWLRKEHVCWGNDDVKRLEHKRKYTLLLSLSGLTKQQSSFGSWSKHCGNAALFGGVVKIRSNLNWKPSMDFKNPHLTLQGCEFKSQSWYSAGVYKGVVLI